MREHASGVGWFMPNGWCFYISVREKKKSPKYSEPLPLHFLTMSGGSAVSKTSYTTVSIVGITTAVVLVGMSIYNVYILNKGSQPVGKSGKTDLTAAEAKIGRSIAIVAIVVGVILAGFLLYEWFRPTLMKTLGDVEVEAGRSALLSTKGGQGTQTAFEALV